MCVKKVSLLTISWTNRSIILHSVHSPSTDNQEGGKTLTVKISDELQQGAATAAAA